MLCDPTYSSFQEVSEHEHRLHFSIQSAQFSLVTFRRRCVPERSAVAGQLHQRPLWTRLLLRQQQLLPRRRSAHRSHSAALPHSGYPSVVILFTPRCQSQRLRWRTMGCVSTVASAFHRHVLENYENCSSHIARLSSKQCDHYCLRLYRQASELATRPLCIDRYRYCPSMITTIPDCIRGGALSSFMPDSPGKHRPT